MGKKDTIPNHTFPAIGTYCHIVFYKFLGCFQQRFVFWLRGKMTFINLFYPSGYYRMMNITQKQTNKYNNGTNLIFHPYSNLSSYILENITMCWNKVIDFTWQNRKQNTMIEIAVHYDPLNILCHVTWQWCRNHKYNFVFGFKTFLKKILF